jgi:hypothetical protein
MVGYLADTLNTATWTPSEISQLQSLLAEVDALETVKNPIQALASSKSHDLTWYRTVDIG